MLRLERHFLTLTSQLIGPVATDLHGTVGRRHLLDVANEPAEGLKNQLPRNVLRGIGLVDLMLHIVAVRRGTELQRGGVLFGMALQRFDLLRAAPRAEDEHPRSQRIKRSGMSHLHLLPHRLREEVTAVGQRPEAAHAIRLVDGDDLSLDKIHAYSLTYHLK